MAQVDRLVLTRRHRVERRDTVLELLEGEPWLGRDPCCDQRQGEVEAAAPGGDLCRRLRDWSASQPTSQQLVGFAGIHGAQRERAGALGGDQPQQPVAAGDDHPSRSSTGKQRPDLLGVPGIVQHNQDSSVGDQTPVELDLLGQAHWGIRCVGTASASRKTRIASPGCTGGAAVSKPRRLR
jgi:hypothetical protein